MALEAGVGRIVVDNPTELRRLSAIAGEMGKTAPVYLRITPGVEAHTHSFIRTGQIDSKFGFTLESGEALQGAEEAVRLDAIALKGFHCHIGSQIFDDEPFVHAAEVMLGFMDQVRQRTGTVAGNSISAGIRREVCGKRPSQIPPGDGTAGGRAVSKKAADLGYPCPYLVLEPGRSVVADAGITLYTVGHVKKNPGCAHLRERGRRHAGQSPVHSVPIPVYRIDCGQGGRDAGGDGDHRGPVL